MIHLYIESLIVTVGLSHTGATVVRNILYDLRTPVYMKAIVLRACLDVDFASFGLGLLSFFGQSIRSSLLPRLGGSTPLALSA